ncbi:hypothetical protein GCM10023205_11650 [Yinghuangia aomiensis]|uniref:NlpC/P60 domain-containing protein n=1 Tax=Yinghuangia aomiensis TaxID=676205 RepID=A0ABP9GTR4_9ACTN
MSTDPFRVDPAVLGELASAFAAFRAGVGAASAAAEQVAGDAEAAASARWSPDTWASAQASVASAVALLERLESSTDAVPGLLRSCAEGYLAGDRFAAELLAAIADGAPPDPPPLLLAELSPAGTPPPDVDVRPQAAILRPDRPVPVPPFRLDRLSAPAVEFGARVAGITVVSPPAVLRPPSRWYAAPAAARTSGAAVPATDPPGTSSAALTPTDTGARDTDTQRAEILRRAKRWSDLGLGYSMSRTFEGYRTDCSGMVSMAWGLPAPGLTTDTLHQVAHPIGKDALLPGDVLVNTAPGAAGHTLIFAGWADDAHTRYYAYEESGGKGAHFGTVPYPYWSGHGLFRPFRLDALGK